VSWLSRLFGGGGGETQPPEPVATPLRSLARRIGVKPGRLAYVLYHDPQPYRTHSIQKATGGTRTIHAPSAARKYVQRRILKRVLQPLDRSPPAHGFRTGRSTFTGARYHRRKPLVVRLDLQDFFPTITAPRVGGLFRALGIPGGEVHLLTRLCTHQGRLPQGAPTSPALANLICRRLDNRLLGLAWQQHFAYTRYADDLTFSGPMRIRGCLPFIRRIIQEEGFVVAEAKTRLMRYGRRQEVTGLVVNRAVHVPRYRRRWLRAIVHNAGRTGLAAQNHTNHPAFRAFLIGNARYVQRTHPREGARLLAAIARLRD
jgi:retron-type reverse transcriptase